MEGQFVFHIRAFLTDLCWTEQDTQDTVQLGVLPLVCALLMSEKTWILFQGLMITSAAIIIIIIINPTVKYSFRKKQHFHSTSLWVTCNFDSQCLVVVVSRKVWPKILWKGISEGPQGYFFESVCSMLLRDQALNYITTNLLVITD